MVIRRVHAHALAISSTPQHHISNRHRKQVRSQHNEMEVAGVPRNTTPRRRMPCSGVVRQTLARRRSHLLLLPAEKARRASRSISVAAIRGGDDRIVDRRDVLLGLGGAAVGGLLTTHRGGALAAPLQAPDLENCQTPDIPANAADPSCCLTYNASAITDFQPAAASSPLRVRPAAHLVDSEYLAKYEKAVALMKALPDDDPRSFVQQARVHCSYCNGAYDQVGFPGLDIQVHNCWFFFPWHRFYTHFHERILGKLIGDDTFALPFWNWDAPGGMTLPAIYANTSSPLYDERRNPEHGPTSLLDLDFSDTDPNMLRDQQVDQNLKFMYRQMVSGAKKKELFLGQPYRAGDAPDPGAGSLENVPHGPLHGWVGDPRQPNGEDMGNFYSAARDPIFFALHSNIDRMWHVWRGLLGPDNADFTDPDWLDASFLFYDEEARLVRCRVRDCLDPAALGYTYQDVGLPWLNTKPAKTAGTPVPAAGALPAKLDTTVRVAVTRPKVSRSPEEKAVEEEVLCVEGIEIADHSRYVKFDVYVNQCAAAGEGTAAAECAGSVAVTPHVVRHETENPVKTTARFGITDLLDAIGADGQKTIVVSLVPRCGGDVVTVSGVSISYVK